MPHGDCPNVMVSEGVGVLTADTSYSDMGHTSPWGVDNRGAAVYQVGHSYTPAGSDSYGRRHDGRSEGFSIMTM